jgi:hypothetical protein
MGYTTNFDGRFELNRKLKKADMTFLTKFAGSRRMKRNLGPEYGVDGEFYVAGADDGNFGQDDKTGLVDSNSPPSTQPGLWCQWVPSEDGRGIEWSGGEKFYEYVKWLEYIIRNFLAPKGYVLNGEVEWQGESPADFGKILVVDNVVTTKQGRRSYD